jgi:hypothetical protein
MHLRYDDDFVEAAVFLWASGRRPGAPALQIRRFHAEREKCYTVADPDERNAAFFKVHLGWFREWGLERLLTGLLKEYPLLPGALNVLAFRQARGRNEEGAELYVTADGARNAMVSVCLERFERDDRLLRFLRHEFMHLHDMIDPAYDYSPQLALRTHNPTEHRITRERYRLLWDITIDGRISRTGRDTITTRERHQALFDRAFPSGPRTSAAGSRRTGGQCSAPREPPRPRRRPARAKPRARALPGGLCPLCGFPTFEWTEVPALNPETLSLLREEFPAGHRTRARANAAWKWRPRR